MLTSQENLLVIEMCELQRDTSPEALRAMAEAYGQNKRVARRWRINTMRDMREYVIRLGQHVMPVENEQGWRDTAVSFADTSLALPPTQIEQAMQGWCEAFVQMRFKTANEAYLEFERIHPFVDGNGRVGWLLWLTYHCLLTQEWLEQLPPDLFATKSFVIG